MEVSDNNDKEKEKEQIDLSKKYQEKKFMIEIAISFKLSIS